MRLHGRRLKGKRATFRRTGDVTLVVDQAILAGAMGSRDRADYYLLADIVERGDFEVLTGDKVIQTVYRIAWTRRSRGSFVTGRTFLLPDCSTLLETTDLRGDNAPDDDSDDDNPAHWFRY